MAHPHQCAAPFPFSMCRLRCRRRPPLRLCCESSQQWRAAIPARRCGAFAGTPARAPTGPLESSQSYRLCVLALASMPAVPPGLCAPAGAPGGRPLRVPRVRPHGAGHQAARAVRPRAGGQAMHSSPASARTYQSRENHTGFCAASPGVGRPPVLGADTVNLLPLIERHTSPSCAAAACTRWSSTWRPRAWTAS